jgi:hypothetical protein
MFSHFKEEINSGETKTSKYYWPVSTVLYILTLWNAEKSLASSVYRDESAGSLSPSQGHTGGTGLKNVYVPSIQCVKETQKCAQFPSVFCAPK